MNPNNFSALVSFVRDEEEGIQQVNQYETAERVITALAAEGMDPYLLLIRCCHLEFGERLIGKVAHSFKDKNQWSQFVSGIVKMGRSWWEENDIFPHETLTKLQEYGTLRELLEHHSTLVTDPEHPLYSEGHATIANDYWFYQVRRFIVKGDFRRAWDEIQKSNRGFLKATIKKEDYLHPGEFIEDCQDSKNRCWSATLECVGALALELYQAMRQLGQIGDITEEDRTSTSWSHISETVYEIRTPRAHRYKPRAFTQHNIPQPAHELAFKFHETNTGDNQRRISETGFAILKITAHFRQQRNEKRRLKYIEALAEYERSLKK